MGFPNGFMRTAPCYFPERIRYKTNTQPGRDLQAMHSSHGNEQGILADRPRWLYSGKAVRLKIAASCMIITKAYFTAVVSSLREPWDVTQYIRSPGAH